jgi:hypothetical protein
MTDTPTRTPVLNFYNSDGDAFVVCSDGTVYRWGGPIWYLCEPIPGTLAWTAFHEKRQKDQAAYDASIAGTSRDRP